MHRTAVGKRSEDGVRSCRGRRLGLEARARGAGVGRFAVRGLSNICAHRILLKVCRLHIVRSLPYRSLNTVRCMN